jgi:hypothetical protein
VVALVSVDQSNPFAVPDAAESKECIPLLARDPEVEVELSAPVVAVFVVLVEVPISPVESAMPEALAVLPKSEVEVEVALPSAWELDARRFTSTEVIVAAIAVAVRSPLPADTESAAASCIPLFAVEEDKALAIGSLEVVAVFIVIVSAKFVPSAVDVPSATLV